MTIPIHPVIFVLFIFCLLIAIFAIGYAIGHNEGELKSAKEIIILTQMEMDNLAKEVEEEKKERHILTHADLVQMEAEAKARMKDADNDKKAD